MLRCSGAIYDLSSFIVTEQHKNTFDLHYEDWREHHIFHCKIKTAIFFIVVHWESSTTIFFFFFFLSFWFFTCHENDVAKYTMILLQFVSHFFYIFFSFFSLLYLPNFQCQMRSTLHIHEELLLLMLWCFCYLLSKHIKRKETGTEIKIFTQICCRLRQISFPNRNVRIEEVLNKPICLHCATKHDKPTACTRW